MVQNYLRQRDVHFGNIAWAEHVPEWLVPSAGPVYFEGRLVLALSFQDLGPSKKVGAPAGDVLLATYHIWDDVSEAPYELCGIELKRYASADVVSKEGHPVWLGIVDTKKRIIRLPDLDTASFLENQKNDLCWKAV